MEYKTKIDAADGRQDLKITREFDLPLDLLFKAYEDPDIVGQWMGTNVLKMENRKHGSYSFETSHQGNVVFKANGTIHEFIPNERIIRTFEMENAEIGVQLEFLEFESINAVRSKLTMQIIYRSEEHRARQLKLPFTYGINVAHNRLEELLSKSK
jgi:uncharacterized protein YndB with AHSA1/START domain